MANFVIGWPDVLVVVHSSLRELSPELPFVIAKEVNRLVKDDSFRDRAHVVRAEAREVYRYPGSPEGSDYFRLTFHFCCGGGHLSPPKWHEEYRVTKNERGSWEVRQIPTVRSHSLPCQ